MPQRDMRSHYMECLRQWYSLKSNPEEPFAQGTSVIGHRGMLMTHIPGWQMQAASKRSPCCLATELETNGGGTACSQLIGLALGPKSNQSGDELVAWDVR